MFGIPNPRTRFWRIIYKTSAKRWASEFPMHVIADKILAPMNTTLALDWGVFFNGPEGSDGYIYETDLTECLVS